MMTSFSRVLSLSVRLLAGTCGAALGAAAVLTLPGCNTCAEYESELVLTREASPTTATLRAVAVDSVGAAVAVGDGGTLLTRDVEGAWKLRETGIDVDLFGVAFARDDSRMIAVGAAGTALISYEGGEVWVPVATGTSAALRGVVFLDADRVVAVGDGVLLHSEDAGETWAPAQAPTTAKLRAVAMRSWFTNWEEPAEQEFELLAVGDAGAVLSSRDGVTWEVVKTEVSADLWAVGAGTNGETSDWVVLGERQILTGNTPELLVARDPGAELLGVSPDGQWKVGADGVVQVSLQYGESGERLQEEEPEGARLLAVAGVFPGLAVGEGGVIVRGDLRSVETGQHLCNSNIVEGRPFVVDEEVRTAEPTARGDWHDAVDVIRLPAATRARLAAAWTRDGLYEHASIASFARFVLQLLAVGAPPELVLAGQAALADEVRHAQACFGLASAFAGAPVGPGPLAVDGALAGPCDLAALAGATAVEGCVNETIAALMATTAAELAQDPAVRERLTAIAADERRHAALAWRTVAWALAQGDASVRAAVAQAFAREPAPSCEAGEDGLESHGRLSRRARVAVARAAWREVIAPQAAALLGTRAPQPRTHAAASTPDFAGAAACG